MRFAIRLLLAGTALCSTAAYAETAAETAALFGARESVLDISLSPSGSKIAYIRPAGPVGESLMVVDLAGAERTARAIFISREPNTRLDYCNWATDDRLVCQAYIIDGASSDLVGYSRMFSIGDDGSEIMRLTADDSHRALGLQQHGGNLIALDVPGNQQGVLMSRQWVKESQLGTRLSSQADGLGVEMVDVYTGKRRTVEKADGDARAYFADDNGRVRLKVRQTTDLNGNLESNRYYYFRTLDSDNWELLSHTQVDSQTYSGFAPIAVDSARNIAYGYRNSDGYESVVAVALDGSGTLTPVVSRNDADVDQLIRIGRRQRVVGASYATEKRQIEYIDPVLKKLAGQLQDALPGKPLINIVDANEDESKLLIIASSDTDPGMVYLLDKGTMQLGEIMPVRMELEGRPMHAMKPVSFPASDGTQIPGYLTLPDGEAKNLPAIVLPHGGPSARDEWGFDWLVQYFTSRGYAVLQPNYRGSSGYGADWFGRNGFKAWTTAIGDVNDAGRWLISQGIADPERLSIMGWSYGGYAALQSQVAESSLYKAIVAIAPVTDLHLLKSENYGYTSYALVSDFVGNGVHVEQGSPAENAASFQSPVLMFHGTIDQNVGVNHSRKMRDKLEGQGKQVEYIEFAGRDHYLEDSDTRVRMLTEIDGFLAKNLGP